jgi:hypothetical protein
MKKQSKYKLVIYIEQVQHKISQCTFFADDVLRGSCDKHEDLPCDHYKDGECSLEEKRRKILAKGGYGLDGLQQELVWEVQHSECKIAKN